MRVQKQCINKGENNFKNLSKNYCKIVLWSIDALF